MALRKPLEAHFQHFWGQLAKWLRMPLDAHFEHFWGQLAKWLSGSLWMLISSITKLSWRKNSNRCRHITLTCLPLDSLNGVFYYGLVNMML